MWFLVNLKKREKKNLGIGVRSGAAKGGFNPRYPCSIQPNPFPSNCRPIIPHSPRPPSPKKGAVLVFPSFHTSEVAFALWTHLSFFLSFLLHFHPFRSGEERMRLYWPNLPESGQDAKAGGEKEKKLFEKRETWFISFFFDPRENNIFYSSPPPHSPENLRPFARPDPTRRARARYVWQMRKNATLIDSGRWICLFSPYPPQLAGEGAEGVGGG